MNGRILAAVFLCLLTPRLAAAEPSVAVRMGTEVAPYITALEGFKEACRCRPEGDGIEKENPATSQVLFRSRSRAGLVIGPSSSPGGALDGLPTIHIMVVGVPAGDESVPVTGVSMVVDPEKQVRILKAVVPGVTEVGMLHTGASGPMAADMAEAAAALSVRVVAVEIAGAEDVRPAVDRLLSHTDAFWLIPDPAVASPEVSRYILTRALEEKVPVLAFSEKFLSAGALLAVEGDAFAMGRQAGRMAAAYMNPDLPDPPNGLVYADTPVHRINPAVAEKLGIPLDNPIDDERIRKATE